MREKRIASLSEDEAEALLYDWEFWSRDTQKLPPGDWWQTWLILAGRGFGKTRIGAETVRHWVKNYQYVNLIGATADDARDIMIEGESGILAICPSWERPRYAKSDRKLLWPNGSISLIFTADEPERLRGKQHHKLWCFIAGTMISSPSGKLPIERLGVGDLVSTRRGDCRILCNSVRVAEVGRVRFSDGSELVGTGEHPVLTSYGWMTLRELSIGDFVQTNTSALTSVRLDPKVSGKTCTSTDGCGKTSADLFRRVITSTIKTKLKLITRSIIWNVSRMANIPVCIVNPGEAGSAAPAQLGLLPVVHAASNCDGGADTRDRIVSDAVIGLQTTEEEQIKSVRIAGKSLSLSGVGSVISVVSTWEHVGLRPVYNLTVDNAHEYFANGILVHNCDEIAAWRYGEECWDQAMLGLRLGDNPQAVVTTTPRPIPLIKSLKSDSKTVLTTGSTYENRANLAPKFFSHVITKYEDTRLGRQELLAEILEDNPGALWTHTMIDALRVKPSQLPALVRIVVGVDPAVSSNETSDEAGIVVVGMGPQWPPHYYVLDDLTLLGSPDAWGTKAIYGYNVHKADRIVAEVNQGGDLVESLLRGKDMHFAYTAVHATRGKIVRAEPIAALYEQGRVHHVGMWGSLEDEMCDYNPALVGVTVRGKKLLKSPNRMDALVWACTNLLEGAAQLGMMDYTKREVERIAAGGSIKPPEPEIGNNSPLLAVQGEQPAQEDDQCQNPACLSFSVSRGRQFGVIVVVCNQCGAAYEKDE